VETRVLSSQWAGGPPIEMTGLGSRHSYGIITLIFRLLTDSPEATRTESSRNLSEMAWFQQLTRTRIYRIDEPERHIS